MNDMRSGASAVARAWAKRAATVGAAFVLAACSADAAPEPEADFHTRGAFVAVDEGGPGLALYRTLDTLALDDQADLVFVTLYDVAPADWDAAREIAKQHDIPVDEPIDALSEAGFPAGPHRVVWFRTLTDEEKDRVP